MSFGFQSVDSDAFTNPSTLIEFSPSSWNPVVPLPTYNTFLPIMGETPAIIKPLTANGSNQPVLVVQKLAVGLHF